MSATTTSTTTTTTTTANGQDTASDLVNGAGGIASGPAGTTDVWSSLLNSVASSRLVPTKDVIILGDPLSGKSTLIELLKTAQPTPSSDPNADAAKSANGGLPNGAGSVNGNTGNGSAPVMVEMGTGTSEDNIFAGAQKKNDLALSYSFWNVEDEENEGKRLLACHTNSGLGCRCLLLSGEEALSMCASSTTLCVQLEDNYGLLDMLLQPHLCRVERASYLMVDCIS